MKIFLFLIIISGIFFVPSTVVDSFGLSCAEPNISESFEESDVVFVGTVISKEYQEPSSQNSFVAESLFSIQEGFKGVFEDQVKVTSDEQFWGINFAQGAQYLVFADYSGAEIQSQLCGPTSLVEYSNVDLVRKIAESNILPPLKQTSLGIVPENVICKDGHVLIFKSPDNSPACVKPETRQRLVERGWATNQENNGAAITIGEGKREGPLLVQKIFTDRIEGLNFPEYPIATDAGYPITLHIGEKASNGCTVELTLVKISNKEATFLKTESHDKPCPICLSEDTEIDTPKGPINVTELKDGMTIFTVDNYGNKQTSTILKTGKTQILSDHMMVHVILDDRRELFVSPNHPTTDGRLFGDLLIGEILDGSKITNVEQVSYNGTHTYDILPSGETGNYWANGILIKSSLK